MQLHHPASLHVLKWSLCLKTETHERGRRTRVEEGQVGPRTVWPRRLVLPCGASWRPASGGGDLGVRQPVSPCLCSSC